MSYTIEEINDKRESFGEYKYRIFKNGQLVAHYWHDYRGDEHGIDFIDGESESWPVGRMVDFLTGGGPQPLGLSKRAVEYLNLKLDR